MHPILLRRIDEQHSRRHKRKIINFDRFASLKWSLTIPFTYDPNNETAHTDSQKEIIREAMTVWEENTCLRFLELTSDEAAAMTSEYIFITARSSGCYSYVGRTKIAQDLNLHSACFSMTALGTIVHEMGHAIGLFHEHVRSDRDLYVTVDLDSTKQGFEGNFIQPDAGMTTNHEVPYDYGSVMHYRAVAFSVDGTTPTILTNDPLYQGTIGQRWQLSFNDALIVNKAYCADGLAPPYCTEPEPPEMDVCGGTVILTEENPRTLEVKSPNEYPSFYKPFTRCNWLIEAPPGYLIQFQFIPKESFVGQFGMYTTDLPCSSSSKQCFDFVEIKYDANDFGTTGPRFCCSGEPTAVVTSVTNRALVLFRSYLQFFILIGFQMDVSIAVGNVRH
ncbi:zinc metalloproteinase dpy-31 [Lingula anatina]|uniref:Metalloendopeptidase n=1 Tax=Lingula anatina TaxID=7574 RepID=A0A1S3K651_LINAN|nr:zinc metalloproteinase dpy-31 [Lingula anatina]|eukprot:XP_013417909.1 zinc metalloproteinase dpy-31 [Lingula anatina]